MKRPEIDERCALSQSSNNTFRRIGDFVLPSFLLIALSACGGGGGGGGNGNSGEGDIAISSDRKFGGDGIVAVNEGIVAFPDNDGVVVPIIDSYVIVVSDNPINVTSELRLRDGEAYEVTKNGTVVEEFYGVDFEDDNGVIDSNLISVTSSSGQSLGIRYVNVINYNHTNDSFGTLNLRLQGRENLSPNETYTVTINVADDALVGQTVVGGRIQQSFRLDDVQIAELQQVLYDKNAGTITLTYDEALSAVYPLSNFYVGNEDGYRISQSDGTFNFEWFAVYAGKTSLVDVEIDSNTAKGISLERVTFNESEKQVILHIKEGEPRPDIVSLDLYKLRFASEDNYSPSIISEQYRYGKFFDHGVLTPIDRSIEDEGLIGLSSQELSDF